MTVTSMIVWILVELHIKNLFFRMAVRSLTFLDLSCTCFVSAAVPQLGTGPVLKSCARAGLVLVADKSSPPFLILSRQEFLLKSLLPAEFESCRSPVLVFLRRSMHRLVGLMIPKD
jgi:hypothetical protein